MNCIYISVWSPESGLGVPHVFGVSHDARSATPPPIICCLLSRHCFPGSRCRPPTPGPQRPHSVHRQKLKDFKSLPRNRVPLQVPRESQLLHIKWNCFVPGLSAKDEMRSFWKGIRIRPQKHLVWKLFFPHSKWRGNLLKAPNNDSFLWSLGHLL